jgi:hypothetical protein
MSADYDLSSPAISVILLSARPLSAHPARVHGLRRGLLSNHRAVIEPRGWEPLKIAPLRTFMAAEAYCRIGWQGALRPLPHTIGAVASQRRPFPGVCQRSVAPIPHFYPRV